MTPRHVSIVAIPEALASSIAGPMDVLSSSGLLLNALAGEAPNPGFRTELVAQSNDTFHCFNGFQITPNKAITDVEHTDIIIIPSLAISPAGLMNKHRELQQWLLRMHKKGSIIASICTGAFLLADTGLLNGKQATTHWAFSEPFRKLYPRVELAPEKSLVINQRIISVGAGSAWHDLVFHLIKDHMGHRTAVESAKMFLLQNHQDGQKPFELFLDKKTHQDAMILQAQKWLADHLAEDDLIARAAAQVELNLRTFKHRFKQATGLSPLHYIQKLRLERAREALELTRTPVEDIARAVGYQDASFFRRVFKRELELTPIEYRKRFGITA